MVLNCMFVKSGFLPSWNKEKLLLKLVVQSSLTPFVTPINRPMCNHSKQPTKSKHTRPLKSLHIYIRYVRWPHNPLCLHCTHAYNIWGSVSRLGHYIARDQAVTDQMIILFNKLLCSTVEPTLGEEKEEPFPLAPDTYKDSQKLYCTQLCLYHNCKFFHLRS